MNKKIALSLFLLFFAIGVFATFAMVSAGGPDIGLSYGKETGLGSQDIRFTVAMIIRVLLGLLGTISVVIILYAGFKWMTAGGNEENVKSAQKILASAVIGLVIIVMAYSITRFVSIQLLKVTQGSAYDNSVEW